MSNYEEEDEELWEKPAWAKGGFKLKSTGVADAMKEDGNLAAPVTFTPYKVGMSSEYAGVCCLSQQDLLE
jgi:hypothetical protein